MQVVKTTGDRALDEEINRILARVSVLEQAPSAPESPEPVPLPPSIPAIMPAQSVSDIADTAVVGIMTSYAREDHVHDGVLSVDGLKGALKHRYAGTVVLGAPSATFVVTHSLAIATPFLVMIDIYTSAGVLVETAGATFVFTTNGLTITFGTPLGADTYSVLVLA